MEYNFDEIIDRRNTNCLKYDFAIERGRPADVLPLWVADMDFRTPREVTEKLLEVARHSIFGYTEIKTAYFQAINSWFANYFNFDLKSEWLVKTPGVVFALALAIRAFTRQGEAVMVQSPVYYPFSETIMANDRRLINNELVYKDGRYDINLIDFERKIIDHNVRLFLLCSPHNPVGRVWTEFELRAMGEICLKHGCLVLSDEIHCDFTYPGHSHRLFASLSDEFAANSIICTAPSKTFNLAGLQVSNIFIADRNVRLKFIRELEKTGYSQLNTMGLAACQSAYAYGADWLGQLKTYLVGNLDYVRIFFKEKLPRIKMVEPQGTYLLWLDFQDLGLSQAVLNDFIVKKAGLWIDDGRMFGSSGTGFQRVNIACPQAVLQRAFGQLEKAVAGL